MKNDIRKIMIIDDNEDIVTMTKAMLEMRGYEVSVKMNIVDLENAITQVSPDLIIMDMLLAGADGREICSNLKKDSRFTSIPVLMISAHPNAEDECLQAGANTFLGKPFEMQDFFNAVEKSSLVKKGN
ncbi:MAG TPA: response regulator [Hanamia sp.]